MFYFSFYFYDFSIRFRNCSDNVVFYIFLLFLRFFYQIQELFRQCDIFYFSFYSTIFLLYLGNVLTVWYFIFLFFLGFFYQIQELFRRCGIFYFSFYFQDFSIRFRNCSDNVVFYSIPFISTIFLLDLGTVPTVWYFLFFLLFLRFFQQSQELFRQCGILYYSFYFYDFSVIFRNCSDSVVCFIFPFISMIFLLDLGTVLTMWYFIFFLLFLGFIYQIQELF